MISTIVPRFDASLQHNLNDDLISKALLCLENRFRLKTTTFLGRSKDVRAYLSLQLAGEQEEVFSVIFLTAQHQLIAFEKMFIGTIDQATVYPRKIIKKALEYNAAKIILAHNHPSNHCEPSRSDREVTQNIKRILGIVDVQLIDHIIVTSKSTYSFAEHGLI